MSEQDNHQSKYRELRSICKYYIESYNALYRLKTQKEEDLNSIYEMIKTNLIDSKIVPAQNIIRDIFNCILYNNRYTKSYLALAKRIFDEYKVKEVDASYYVSRCVFYKEYGIKLRRYDFYHESYLKNLDILSENTIYRAIMNDDLEQFILFTERETFDKDEKLISDLYPCHTSLGYSLLELCCYYGSVDCFKLLRSKFNSEITRTCLECSFLSGNPDIMSECMKYQKPNEKCMEYAIISHNIDFVTFLMNEYNIQISLYYCLECNDIDSFLVYFDQTNDIGQCFLYSIKFGIPSICEYFLSHGANINAKNQFEDTVLQIAVNNNNKEIVELFIKYGADVNEKNIDGETALHIAVANNYKEIAEILIINGADINEKDNDGKTALHKAAINNSKDVIELLLSYGLNINEKDNDGETALHIAVANNYKEIAEILIINGADINEKDNDGKTALHKAAINNSKDVIELLLSHGLNINEKDNDGETALQKAVKFNSKEAAEILRPHGANIEKCVIL